MTERHQKPGFKLWFESEQNADPSLFNPGLKTIFFVIGELPSFEWEIAMNLLDTCCKNTMPKGNLPVNNLIGCKPYLHVLCQLIYCKVVCYLIYCKVVCYLIYYKVVCQLIYCKVTYWKTKVLQ